MQAAFEIGQKVVAKVSLKSFSEEFQEGYAATGFGVVTKIDDRLPHIVYRVAAMCASDWFDERQLECVSTLENLVVDIEGERKMTNHEQRIILAWLEAELALTHQRILKRVADKQWGSAERLSDEYQHLIRQREKVAALDTSRPALTEDERKAQAAGVLGKMGNGVRG